MNSEFIPNDLARFILDNIDSVAQLEALMLLRACSAQHWNLDELAKRLYITERETVQIMGRLCAEGLVVSNMSTPPAYYYQPNSSEIQRLVDCLAETYSKHLVPVTNLIHSKPRSRVQEFADAFKLRKEE